MSEEIVESWVFHWKPIRVKWDWDYEKKCPAGDYAAAEEALKEAGIEIKYKTVTTVPTTRGFYEGTLYVDAKDFDKAVKVLEEKGIKWYPAESVYPLPKAMVGEEE